MNEGKLASTDYSSSSPEHWKGVGNTHLASREYPDAIRAYTTGLTHIDDGAVLSTTPSLRGSILSNRSYAHALSGSSQLALEDAEELIALEPTWCKSQWRRGQALAAMGDARVREALEAFDDALALWDGKGKKNDTETVKESIEADRQRVERSLRMTGATRLCEESARMGNLLAVPEGMRVRRFIGFAAKLRPALFSGVDTRNGVQCGGEFPGDPAWPMVHVTIVKRDDPTQMLPAPMLNYYIVGQCVLTQACSRELDDLFAPEPCHSARWPNADSVRTCPFCATGIRPGRGEVCTMVVHLLTASTDAGFGMRNMAQLCCPHCTKRMLRKARLPPRAGDPDDSANSSDDEDDSVAAQLEKERHHSNLSGAVDHDFNILPRLRALCDPACAIKASTLWIRALNSALIASMQDHATRRFQAMLQMAAPDDRDMSSMQQKQTGSHSEATDGDGSGAAFDAWVGRMKGENSFQPEDRDENPPGTRPTDFGNPVDARGNRRTDAHMGQQMFTILQVQNIRDKQKALKKFWDRHGSAFRRRAAAWSAEDDGTDGPSTSAFIYVKRRVDQIQRKTNYHHMEDPRPLVSAPFGTAPRGQPCFLPEVGNTAFFTESIVELMRERANELCIEKDVAHVTSLKRAGKLPRLAVRPDGEFLCDYMGLRDPSVGPFVVFIGRREPEYDETGIEDDHDPFAVETLIKSRQYTSLREPWKDNIAIYSAYTAGRIRDILDNLMARGAATDAVVYIYAAFRQMMLLDFLLDCAQNFCEENLGEKAVKNLRKGAKVCFVCSKRRRADGSALQHCSRCESIFYCSKECQKRDWKRHKVQSCLGSPNFPNAAAPAAADTAAATTTATSSSEKAQKKKKKKKKSKGKK